MVPGSGQLTCLAGPPGEVAADGHGVAVLGSTHPLADCQQGRVLVPGSGRIPCLSGPEGEVIVGDQGVGVVWARAPARGPGQDGPAAARQLRLINSPRTVLRWQPGGPAKLGLSALCSRPPAGSLRPWRNPGWSCRRIHGELTKRAHKLAPPAVRQILDDAGIGPAPSRTGQAWRAFLEAQAKMLVAASFFCVGTVFLRRLHVLLFTGHGTWRMNLAGITVSPHQGVGKPPRRQPADEPRGPTLAD